MKEGRDGFLMDMGDGKVFGVCFGADSTAEHECGIRRIKELFKINPDANPGIARRTIKKNAGGIMFFETEDFTLLVFNPYVAGSYKADEQLENFSWITNRLSKECDMRTAWDERGFAVTAFTEESRKAVKDLHEAFKSRDVAMWIGGGNSWLLKGTGLVLCIVSQIPRNLMDKMAECDIDHSKLVAAAGATGIAKRLEAADLGYFSLSPKWANEEKTELRFWLNPINQRDYNYGWFTVEELDAWIAGTGPVPMKK